MRRMCVVQDACIAMWRRIDTLRDEQGFLPWVYTFVRLTALNRVRKPQRSKLVFSEALVELNAQEAMGESDRAKAEYRALRDCIDRLPTPQRVLVNRYYAETKVRMEDLAKQMDRPVAGLYKAPQRARRPRSEWVGLAEGEPGVVPQVCAGFDLPDA